MLNGWLLYQTLACRISARVGLLPGERRLRLPRPAAGRDGADLRAARGDARAPAARRRPAVPRGRRPALVAAAFRPGRAHPHLRRPRLAGLRRRHLRRRRPATRACSTRSCRSSKARRSPRASTTPSSSRWPPRPRPRSSSTARAASTRPRADRPAGPAADRHRRLERRHEPRGRGRPGRERLARLAAPAHHRALRAAGRAPRPGARRPLARPRRRRCARRSRPRPGTATGTAARPSTTAPGSARRPATSAGSTPSPSPGRCSRARPIRPARAQAMASLDRAPDPRATTGLALLFTPPFDATPHDPGYIKGYPPGLRENGGQYSHAAMWAVLAFAELGDGDAAHRLFALLNPINHARDPADVAPLQGRALRGRGRRLFGRAARRARRLDLVHRLGRLDVPRRRRGHPGPAPRRRNADRPPPPARRLAGLRGDGEAGRRDGSTSRSGPWPCTPRWTAPRSLASTARSACPSTRATIGFRSDSTRRGEGTTDEQSLFPGGEPGQASVR